MSLFLLGVSWDSLKAGAWDHLEAPSCTCLLAGALAGLLAGTPPHASSGWSGLPCNMVAGLQGQASCERMRQMETISLLITLPLKSCSLTSTASVLEKE